MFITNLREGSLRFQCETSVTVFHQLSAVDALSFVLMAERRIRVAFAFDGHFATAGFRMVG